ncbi:MAG: hypothetical protein K5905_12670 [Roseibium sp.]|uniref:hypothetical protein n=1 Tax=Roseibium sp. TaxID=1936156 RepID=UPI002632F29A|nr:hypothetical protein [Roseibium sp.]MCV0426321.1 hypothetical protein [Roseibium sp.]
MGQSENTGAIVSVTCRVRADDAELLNEIARNLTDQTFRTGLVDVLKHQSRPHSEKSNDWRVLAPF